LGKAVGDLLPRSKKYKCPGCPEIHQPYYEGRRGEIMAGFSDWMDGRVQTLGWIDMGLVKLSVFAFALMVAKLWEPILSLEWYWYGIIFVLAAVPPIFRIFRQR
jgi:hypothetical protein